MSENIKPEYYNDYLKLDQVLSSQTPLSEVAGRPAHDEHLFIVVHQAFELWFKQIIYEIDSVLAMFKADSIDERSISVAVARMERVHGIQKVIVDFFPILETMTPMDFLDFRDLLGGTSGLQSVQFRLLENKLGLLPGDRLKLAGKAYTEHVHKSDQKEIKQIESESSLFTLVELWLERIPFIKIAEFDFLESYRQSVEQQLDRDAKSVDLRTDISDEVKQAQLAMVGKTKEHFSALFDEKKHQELQEKGKKRLSHRATMAALFIMLYRDQPILHMPFRLVNTLMNIDEAMTSWRSRHSLMIHRMLGRKIGTGGSSGYDYLRTTIEKHKVFSDFFNLSSFLIPRSQLPQLPKKLKEELDFHFSIHASA